MDNLIHYGKLAITLPDLRVYLDGKEIHPSMQQMKLIMVFMYEPYRSFKPCELVERVDMTSESALRTLIVSVRRLLDDLYIVTNKTGYSFADPIIAEWNNELATAAKFDDDRGRGER